MAAKKQQECATREIELSKLEVNRGQLYGLPKNPRFIRDDRFESLKKSIREDPEMLSLRELIVYPLDNGNFLVVGGNMRLRACEELGYEALPCKVLPVETPVAKLRAYVVKDNVAFGENDWDAFANEWDLDELKGFGLELDGVDFGEDEAESNDVEEDDFNAEEAEPRCRKGDIWQLGAHRLMCGDSTDAKSVAKLMDGRKANLLLTDPPYGVNIVQGATVVGDKTFGTLRSDKGAPVSFKGTTSRPKSREIVPATKYMPIKGDESTETARKSFEIAKGISETQVIFGGNYFTDFLPPSRCWIVWDKGVPEGAFFTPLELAWVNKDANSKLYKIIWSGLYREGDRDVEGVKRVHPTQKPVALCSRILEDFTKEGDGVLDLFGGSGTTLIACEQLGRKCLMMEFEAHYCDVIISRWEQLTGKTAQKISGDA